MFLISCLWSLCLDICGRTVKLSFLSCGLKGVRRTTVKTHTAGEYLLCTGGSDVCYDVTQTVSFRNVENRLFSFSSMLDNDYWATEIIWRTLETD